MTQDVEMAARYGGAASDGGGAYLPPPRDGVDLDDDGNKKRTGTVWTANAHIITAVIGSGVLSLAWSTAQLGWVVGPVTLMLFSVITYYTSSLLADCYRTGDQVTGKRNYTYMDAVASYLCGWQVWSCGVFQYVNLVGTAVGYTITASISAAAVHKSNCFHKNGHAADCGVYDTMYMVVFGVVQIFSQLPNFHELSWLSILSAIMSSYSSIAVGLALARTISDTAKGDTSKTTLTGTEVGVDVDSAQKVWLACQALGNIAFAYSYSMILIEIQDTVKSPPAENKTMKKAILLGVTTTTSFYMLVGCLGYAAFGNAAPGNILTGFGFYEPFWLIDLANICIVVHLVGAYQVFSQPIFAAVETWATARWPNAKFLTREHTVASGKFSFNVFRLTWRTAFMVVSTVLAIVMPFFNDILGFLGAVGFWPLTVYYPVEMYIRQRRIQKYTTRWVALQVLSFLVSLAAAVASIEGVTESLKYYVPFKTKS